MRARLLISLPCDYRGESEAATAAVGMSGLLNEGPQPDPVIVVGVPDAFDTLVTGLRREGWQLEETFLAGPDAGVPPEVVRLVATREAETIGEARASAELAGAAAVAFEPPQQMAMLDFDVADDGLTWGTRIRFGES